MEKDKVATVATMVNLAKIVRELGTREQCIQYAIDNELIPSSKECRVHKKPMCIEYGTNDDVGFFVCNKGDCRSSSRVACGKGTWFEGTKISMPKVFYLMYCYAHRWTYEAAIHEDSDKSIDGGCISSSTVTAWYNYCREIVVLYHLETRQTICKIGGPGKVVQIDENKLGERKCNKGLEIEGQWVLGMLEEGTEEMRLELCPHNARSAEVLIPLIKKHVAEGTMIHTDGWPAYDSLGEHGYIHKKNNNADQKNPSDRNHLQKIRTQWWVVQRFFRKEDYEQPSEFGDLMVEYQWRRSVQINKKDPFLELITAIKYVYKF